MNDLSYDDYLISAIDIEHKYLICPCCKMFKYACILCIVIVCAEKKM